MFERNEQTEQVGGHRPPASPAMPQQAPPVDRTRTTPLTPEHGSGVEAAGLLRMILGI
ncbi:hypothetical protein GT045_31870 [Streptomyces sp. SID486]|uniref:hypothetical protein n=1 Tax=unclassified Streptomyces TaxID=2593676 RepID=UPI001371C122|nr:MULTISPECIES: hypothetical protein [unclassified Streptomyces]MYW14423.1 hypothetical protein [Streptomyces sp. SID2955]MYW48346.1 hypothetical protein [Streptomyces sp. SID161]MYX99276.1 hypothetical protein [Streptomyces sp. SID486]